MSLLTTEKDILNFIKSKKNKIQKSQIIIRLSIIFVKLLLKQ